jgi:hypothetical protein
MHLFNYAHHTMQYYVKYQQAGRRDNTMFLRFLIYLSGDIKEHIDSLHELVQILHHAYVYDFRFILLLIGDSTSAIISGIWVKFDDAIKESYGALLRLVYERCLKWAYDPTVDMPVANIKKILPQINKDLDFESFQGHFALWKYVSKRIKGPLPRLYRIIPLVFSTWNSLKGGSDTVTKLLWEAHTQVPCKSPQVKPSVTFCLFVLFYVFV